MKLEHIRDFERDWMYLERFVNDGSDHKYRHQTDLPKPYRPSQASPFKLRAVHHTEDVAFIDDAKLDAFPVHPAVAGQYQKAGKLLSETPIEVIPTSSSRTVLCSSKPDYFLKLDVPLRISRFKRGIEAREVRYSRQIDSIIGRSSWKRAMGAFGVLRETGGGLLPMGRRTAGFIARDVKPTWVSAESPEQPYVLVPAFSMISTDSRNPGHQPLLIQVVSNTNDPTRAVLDQILKPLFDFWCFWADRGLLWEMQGQNTLFALGRSGAVVGIVLRDYDAIHVNLAVRRAIGDQTIYLKHRLDSPDLLRTKTSLVFDHRVCKQNLSRLISCFEKYFGPGEARKVDEELKAYIAERLPLGVKDVLPSNYWYTCPEVMFSDGIELEMRENPPLRVGSTQPLPTK